MPAPLDLTGRTFGRLTVVGRAGKWWRRRGRYWICRCDCDPSVLARPVLGSNLLGGNTTSCGCVKAEGELARIAQWADERRREWKPEEDALLGRMPDRDVARRLGIDDTTVGGRRKSLGVPPYSTMGAGPRRKWSEEDLEALAAIASDRDAAERFGVSEKAIRTKRARAARAGE